MPKRLAEGCTLTYCKYAIFCSAPGLQRLRQAFAYDKIGRKLHKAYRVADSCRNSNPNRVPSYK